MSHFNLQQPRIPIFFKLWFAFLALIAVSSFAFVAWIALTIAGDPGSIGRFFGQVAAGFSEASK
jgi:hypothetical protein